MRELDHPRKATIELVRRIIRGVDTTIDEGIKWNAPSFRTTDWFATVNLRGRGGEAHVWLVLHTGAKAKVASTTGHSVPDPANLLRWLAKDRAVVVFEDEADVRAKRSALEAIVRTWIGQMVQSQGTVSGERPARRRADGGIA